MRRYANTGTSSLTVGLIAVTLWLACSDDDKGPTGGSVHADSVVQIAEDGSHPTVSPQGDWVAFRTSSGIYKVPTTGGNPVRIFGNGYEPDWSWAHDLILVRYGGVTVFSPNSGEIVTTLSVYYDDGPCWSPDGTEIAAQDDGIVVFSYPDGDGSIVSCTDTLDGGCEGEGPSWSPDGQTLAFEDGLEILTVPRSGGTATPIVYGLRDVSYPAWSPDGNWIAFLMDDTLYQHAHIWVTDARGQDYALYQMTSGDYLDYAPAWSPDSKYIYFARHRVDSAYYYTPLGIWRVRFGTE